MELKKIKFAATSFSPLHAANKSKHTEKKSAKNERKRKKFPATANCGGRHLRKGGRTEQLWLSSELSPSDMELRIGLGLCGMSLKCGQGREQP